MSAAKVARQVGRVDGASPDGPARTLLLLARFARAQARRPWVWLACGPGCTACRRHVRAHRKAGAR